MTCAGSPVAAALSTRARQCAVLHLAEYVMKLCGCEQDQYLAAIEKGLLPCLGALTPEVVQQLLL